MNWQLDQNFYEDRLYRTVLFKESGKITKSAGLLYEAHLPGASIGSICEIIPDPYRLGSLTIEAEVVGFRDKKVQLMPYEDINGINNESIIILKQMSATVKVGDALLGRVLDARGNPLDEKGPLLGEKGRALPERDLYQKPSHPLEREVIKQPIDLGVRALNGLLTCGKGQRIGIMAGSGVGKSVLLGMMAKRTNADVNVIALIGERGREVREFIERDLGEEGLKRSVIVVATSDKSPLLRMRGAFLATTIAEYFRDQGKDVLLMMDSVTRFCMAQREIGLSLGEPPASKGYTPSVFSTLPKLLERAGTAPKSGSITGLYTVLVEGDDMDDPVADSARSILDGHVVLTRKLAQKNHFPAIDVLQSTSRVMRSVTTDSHQNCASLVREWMATYAQIEDLVNIGAYVKGSNPKYDQAIFIQEKINQFLRQSISENENFSQAVNHLQSICKLSESYLASLGKK